jgi:hypothetical protein
VREYDELSEAWGEWIGGLREWTLFGGETFDQRRRRFQHVETRSGGVVERGVDARGFPRAFWGSHVEYSYVLEAPREVPRDVAIRRFETFIRRGEKILQKPIDYVCALQSQKNGWIHYHPLLAMGELEGGEISALGKLWYEMAGGCKLSVPRDGKAVSAYACRYLSRDLAGGDVLLSARLRQPYEAARVA